MAKAPAGIPVGAVSGAAVAGGAVDLGAVAIVGGAVAGGAVDLGAVATVVGAGADGAVSAGLVVVAAAAVVEVEVVTDVGVVAVVEHAGAATITSAANRIAHRLAIWPPFASGPGCAQVMEPSSRVIRRVRRQDPNGPEMKVFQFVGPRN